MSNCAARFGFVCCCSQCKPAPSPQPEMPHGWHFSPATGGVFVSRREDGGQYALGITLMRALLATQGLTIVGPAERAVLDDLTQVPKPVLLAWRTDSWLRNFAGAELARRAGKT